MKTVVVLAIHRRPVITRATLQWLKNLPIGPEVVCVGDSSIERAIAQQAGVHYVEHENRPLSAKYQAGIAYTKSLKPDFVMTAGSDSWVTPLWFQEAISFLIETDADVTGKSNFALWNIEEMRLILRGYPAWREHEPDGNGRIITAAGLEKLGWVLYPDTWRSDNGIDGASHKLSVERGLDVQVMNDANEEWVMEIKAPKRYKAINPFSAYVGGGLKQFGDYAEDAAVDWLDERFPYWDEYLGELL